MDNVNLISYTQHVISKRGPLAKIWLSAHWERKITKANVFECNLESTVKDILSPQIMIGLRLFGHLLLGVVRIYSRKAKYLLEDCKEARVKLKVEFRPGQTDMPLEGFEATLKDITLMEDFTVFDTTPLPHPNNIDLVDQFSLNQCRTEEITIKEDLGNVFLNLVDFGDDSHYYDSGLLDMSYRSLARHGDGFGDEETEFDLLDFMTSFSDQAALSGHVTESGHITEEPHSNTPESPTGNIEQQDATRSEPMDFQTPAMRGTTPEVEASAFSETTLLANDEDGFALEPVAVTPTSTKRTGKRKRRLLVDHSKELSNEAIRDQLLDFSDLIGPLDLAPPTIQLMLWKQNGAADKLFGRPCVPVIHLQLQQLFTMEVFRRKTDVVEETEETRTERQEAVQRDAGVLSTDDLSILHESAKPQQVNHNAELSPLHHRKDEEESSVQPPCDSDNRTDFSLAELPSEVSMCVHPSGLESWTPSTIIHTQSMLDSQDVEERSITSRAHKLLHILQIQSNGSNTTFTLGALCEGSTRSQTAATFFSLLVLKKQEALELHQNTPYGDIVVTPGPRFHDP